MRSFFGQIIWLVVFATAANAAPITGNIGGGDSFDSSNQYVLTDGIYADAVYGIAFTPTQDISIYSVEVAISNVLNGQYDLELRADNNGKPGSVLDEVTLIGALATPQLHEAIFAAPVALTAGNLYWVAVNMRQGQLNWHFNDTGNLSSGGDLARLNFSWSVLSDGLTMPAFRINEVPEPTTGLMVATGLVLLAARRRR